MLAIPAIDILNGAVVRLARGDFTRVTTYDPDPVSRGHRWMDEGAKLVHVVDLEGARGGVPDPGIWSDLTEAGVVFQVGGGIRDARTASTAIDCGATRVVVGTALVGNVDDLKRIVAEVGSDFVVAAVDVRNGRAHGSGWLDEGISFESAIERVIDSGAGHLLVTGINSDGLMEGPDGQLMERVRRLAPNVDLIASGGVGSLEDVSMLASMGCAGAVVGRALYEGKFTFAQAQFAATAHGGAL